MVFVIFEISADFTYVERVIIESSQIVKWMIEMHVANGKDIKNHMQNQNIRPWVVVARDTQSNRLNIVHDFKNCSIFMLVSMKMF